MVNDADNEILKDLSKKIIKWHLYSIKEKDDKILVSNNRKDEKQRLYVYDSYKALLKDWLETIDDANDESYDETLEYVWTPDEVEFVKNL